MNLFYLKYYYKEEEIEKWLEEGKKLESEEKRR